MTDTASAIRNAIASGKERVAISLFIEGISSDADGLIGAIRKKGTFRASQYKFDPSIIKKLLAVGEDRGQLFTVQIVRCLPERNPVKGMARFPLHQGPMR